ncbi:MAG: HEAT repeat domain-containing protein [Candidatus Omnitrophica bacterium]|nr:HEAT repeat domain-containing protein [Candidatus Omnitrophota bacterium]
MIKKSNLFFLSIFFLIISYHFSFSQDSNESSALSDDSLTFLIDKIESTNGQSRSEAVYELASRGGPIEVIVPLLTDILNEADYFWFYSSELSYSNLDMEAIRPNEMAGLSLVKIGKPAAEYLISQFLGDEPQNRANALIVLAMMRDDAYLDHIINGLRDSDKRVRVNAARLLGELRHNRSVVPLILALDDKAVRVDAIKSLGLIGDFQAVKPLIDLLKLKDETLKDHVAAALEALTGQKLPADYRVWQSWQTENSIKYGR